MTPISARGPGPSADGVLLLACSPLDVVMTPA